MISARIRHYAGIFALAAACCALYSPSWGVRLNLPQVLAKGINFDHIFDPYRKHAKPLLQKEIDEIEAALRKDEFRQVARLGFTHIRLNLGRAFLQEPSPSFAMRPEGLELLDRALDMAAAQPIAVVLDMHQIPVPDLARDPAELKAFTEMWKVLGARYRSRKQAIVFEVLNEPRLEDHKTWRRITLELIAAIRSIDPDRAIVVSGGKWGGIEELIALGDLGVPNLAYSFHFYDPFVFTHQGTNWGDPVLAGIREISYPLDISQLRTARERAVQEGRETWPFDAWPNGCGKKELESTMRPVIDFAAKGNLLLYCGEFGAYKPIAPLADRALWTKDMRELLEKHGICWAMWAYHSGFDLVEENGSATPEIAKALGLRGR